MWWRSSSSCSLTSCFLKNLVWHFPWSLTFTYAYGSYISLQVWLKMKVVYTIRILVRIEIILASLLAPEDGGFASIIGPGWLKLDPTQAKNWKKRVPTLEPDNSGREAATENVKHVLEMGDHSGCFLFSTLKPWTPPSGSKIELKILTFSGRQKMKKSGADFGS